MLGVFYIKSEILSKDFEQSDKFGGQKTETSGRNDKNTEKQFYTECVEGKMKGCLSLVFFSPPNCYFGGRKKL